MVKPASILVRRLNIALQDDLTTFKQRFQVKGSLVTEGLVWFGRVVANDADCLNFVANTNFEGVSIGDADDGCFDGLTLRDGKLDGLSGDQIMY